jgi:hypothetical protein
MTEPDFLSRRPAGFGLSLRALLGTSLLAFIGGAALIGWLVYAGKLPFDLAFNRSQVTASASGVGDSAAADPDLAAAAAGGMDQRIAALEQRLTRLDLQAAAAEGNAARAEALLVALATRRAIERGAPLGYLENQLKLRFGNAQENAVITLTANARRPVTLDRLSSDLDALAPALLGKAKDEGGWQRLTRDLSGLFVIRRGDAATSQPDQRLERARLMLRGGQIDAAIAEVQSLPGARAAAGWLPAARRYGASQRALDLIETSALLEPSTLNNAAGAAVRQPGIGAPPAP